jgi:mannose-6-phosphate isomerase
MTFLSKPYILNNKIQSYAWGERGSSAFIPKFLGMRDVDDSAPFAELWMGTHPLGTSSLLYQNKQTLLSELVQRYPFEILGARVAAEFGNQFPFLLKILSANEPLSIQLHPSKVLAEMLHSKDPVNYPDANHKPEIAIALEQLRALAGMRDSRQINPLMKQYPELRVFIQFKTFSRQPKKYHAKLAFFSLFQNALDHPNELKNVIERLIVRLNKKNRLNFREKLFLEMSAKYPGDVGLLSIFFLKLHTLSKGQGVFIPAGVPHAYLKGNIVECMASSDNVIRAGLTGKFKDIPALLEVANDKSVVKFSPKTRNFTYPAPVREFRVGKMALKVGQKIFEESDSVRILLILRGRLKLTWNGGELEAAQGQSILLPASLSGVRIECLVVSELYKADVP